MKLNCGKTKEERKRDCAFARKEREKKWHYKFVWHFRIGTTCYVLHWLERRRTPYYEGSDWGRGHNEWFDREMKPYFLCDGWQWREPFSKDPPPFPIP